MTTIDPRDFEDVVKLIDDGFMFERFSHSFCASVLGYKFVPVGGIKDKGIDGLEHISNREGKEMWVYQVSIEKRPESKISKTVTKLKNNEIKLDRFFYITNLVVPDKYKIIDDIYEEHNVSAMIFDLTWLVSHCNYSAATINVYYQFVDSYVNETRRPGKEIIVDDLDGDPRIFVYLRQHVGYERGEQDRPVGLFDHLIDSLIFFALKDTDPDKSEFRAFSQIIETVEEFSPRESMLHDVVNTRLSILTQRPRKINYHSKEKAYCLPYETRVELKEKGLLNDALRSEFLVSTEGILKSYLKEESVHVRDCTILLEKVISKIFHQQGLEFSSFILQENAQAKYPKLSDVVSDVVEKSSVIPKNKGEVRRALLLTIRQVVYSGDSRQKLFLKRLSQTYLMYFATRCDPKLSSYFNSMAGKLTVYVCTSIIIPALSEKFLEPQNRRYWSLLIGAKEVGVKLVINKAILDELTSHFSMIMDVYKQNFEGREEFYNDRQIIACIDHIMIRSYFYSRLERKVTHFIDFIDHFVSPNSRNAINDLQELLKEEFGIQYQTNESLGVEVDDNELRALTNELKRKKSHDIKAINDAKTFLTIYALREKNNENGSAGIFSYKTWWLSTDTSTLRAFCKVFGDRSSCYIRSDFLSNFIAFLPKKARVDSVFDKVFPSMVGINIAYHLGKNEIDSINEHIKQYSNYSTSRVRSSIRNLTESLMEGRRFKSKREVRNYLGEQMNE